VERSTFVIGPDGKLGKVWPKVKPAGHAEEVLAWLRSQRKS
jgi:peroxiredoxin Q/BCP